MPGRAERVRRARRLAAVLAVVTVALVLALVLPGVRSLLGRGEGPDGSAPSNSPSTSSGSAPPASTPSATPSGTAGPTPVETATPSGDPDGDPRPTAEVGVSECGRTAPAVRPARLTLTCGSALARVVVTDVEWGSWGQLNALGTAALVANDCEPTCAEGDDRSYAATVVLDRVVTTRGGSQFSRATVVWSDLKPDRLRDPLQVTLRVYPG